MIAPAKEFLIRFSSYTYEGDAGEADYYPSKGEVTLTVDNAASIPINVVCGDWAGSCLIDMSVGAAKLHKNILFLWPEDSTAHFILYFEDTGASPDPAGAALSQRIIFSPAGVLTEDHYYVFSFDITHPSNNTYILTNMALVEGDIPYTREELIAPIVIGNDLNVSVPSGRWILNPTKTLLYGQYAPGGGYGALYSIGNSDIATTYVASLVSNPTQTYVTNLAVRCQDIATAVTFPTYAWPHWYIDRMYIDDFPGDICSGCGWTLEEVAQDRGYNDAEEMIDHIVGDPVATSALDIDSWYFIETAEFDGLFFEVWECENDDLWGLVDPTLSVQTLYNRSIAHDLLNRLSPFEYVLDADGEVQYDDQLVDGSFSLIWFSEY